MKYNLFCVLLAVALAEEYSNPRASKSEYLETNLVSPNSTVRAAASCRDPDLSRYINNAVGSYIHNMDLLTRNILDQITQGRKSGQWLVHAQVISSSRQGPDWQTTTNSPIFSGKDFYGCFYHDMQTYILVLRVY